MLNIKLITHTDLDGVGCEIVLKTFLKYYKERGYEYHISTDYVNYNELGSHLCYFIDDELDNYDIVFITDLSFREETIYAITQHFTKNTIEKFKKKAILIDHHESSLNSSMANLFNNIVIKTSNSATKLFAQTLKSNNFELLDLLHLKFPKDNCLYNPLADELQGTILDNIINSIDSYDTWRWVQDNNYEANKLNDLFGYLKLEGFKEYVLKMVDTFIEQHHGVLNYANIYMDTKYCLYSYQNILDEIDKKREDYITMMSKNMFYTNLSDIVGIEKRLKKSGIEDNYRIGSVIGTKYISVLGNRLCKENPIDIALIFNPDRMTVSLRTTSNNIDLSKLAPILFGNGGGHRQASGASYTKDDFVRIFGSAEEFI